MIYGHFLLKFACHMNLVLLRWISHVVHIENVIEIITCIINEQVDMAIDQISNLRLRDGLNNILTTWAEGNRSISI